MSNALRYVLTGIMCFACSKGSDSQLSGPLRGEFAPHGPIRASIEDLARAAVAGVGVAGLATIEEMSFQQAGDQTTGEYRRVRVLLSDVELIVGSFRSPWTRIAVGGHEVALHDERGAVFHQVVYPIVTTGDLSASKGTRVLFFAEAQIGETESGMGTDFSPIAADVLFGVRDGRFVIASEETVPRGVQIVDNQYPLVDEFVEMLQAYASKPEDACGCGSGSYCWMRAICVEGERPETYLSVSRGPPEGSSESTGYRGSSFGGSSGASAISR